MPDGFFCFVLSLLCLVGVGVGGEGCCSDGIGQ